MRVRSRAVLLVGVFLLTTSACGAAHQVSGSEEASSISSEPTSEPSTVDTTTSSTVLPVACRGSQLQGRLGGIEGAAGNLVAGFWIADVSPQPCSLQSPVAVDLLDNTGAARMTGHNAFAPVPLTGSATLPADITSSVAQIATVAVEWATTANASPGDSGQCPRPIFTPASARIMFGNGAYIIVPASTTEAPGQAFDICGSGFGVLVFPPTSG